MDRAFAGAAPYLRRSAGGALSVVVVQEPGKRRNVRTALVLVSIVAAFFVGIMIKVALFGL